MELGQELTLGFSVRINVSFPASSRQHEERMDELKSILRTIPAFLSMVGAGSIALMLGLWALEIVSTPKVFNSTCLEDVGGLRLAVIAVSLSFTMAGTVSATQHRETPGLIAENSRRLVRLLQLSKASGAFTTAALAATLLELTGLWKRMTPNFNPLQDRGAPVWAWWGLLALSFLFWFVPRQARSGVKSFKWLTRRISILTFSALSVALSAVLLYIGQPDPVQGRYYGIPGFVVGRHFWKEYGLYYGTAGGVAAAILGLLALISIFYWLRKPAPKVSQS
jgi:hypothetical protein